MSSPGEPQAQHTSASDADIGRESDLRSSSNDPGDPQAIEHSIERTRDRLDRTLDALQNKLSPGQLLDRWLDYLKRNGSELAGNLGRNVKQNPFPLLLTTAGLAWLITTSSREPDRNNTGPASIGDSASEVAGSVGRAASGASSRLADTAQNLREQGRQASASLSRLMREQPLLMGLATMATGALLGAALPRTETEDRWIGGARDDRAAQARQVAADIYEHARATARDTMHSPPGPAAGEPAPTRTH